MSMNIIELAWVLKAYSEVVKFGETVHFFIPLYEVIVSFCAFKQLRKRAFDDDDTPGITRKTIPITLVRQ